MQSKQTKNNYCKYHSNYPWKFPLNSNRFLVEMTVYQREFVDKTIKRDNGSIVFCVKFDLKILMEYSIGLSLFAK